MTTLDVALAGRSAWRRRFRQGVAVARIELRHALLGRGSIPLWLLAAAPLTVFLVWSMAGGAGGELRSTGEYHAVYAALYHTFLLRVVVFFGCVAAFSNVFRREIQGETLHYYLLTAVRREVLVAGKYVAALLATWLVFGLVTAVTFLLFYVPIGYDVVTAQVARDGLTYVGLTALACLGWGAIFLALSLYVRNPIIPAVVIMGWEAVSFVLPSAAQKLSIVQYLEEMSPVPIPEGGPFAIPVEPTPAWLSVPGLVALSALALLIAAHKVRRLEIDYTSD